jgi:hypothetical protein
MLYLAPFLSLALFWRARAMGSGPVPAGTEREASDGPGMVEVTRSALAGRLPLARPVGGGLLVIAILVGAAAGPAAASWTLAGAIFGVLGAALGRSSALAAGKRSGGEEEDVVWVEACALALGLSSMSAGAIGGAAWFFADPSGVVVLAAFLLGASCSVLFLDFATARLGETEADEASPSGTQVGFASLLPAPLPCHFATVAAALLVAATAEPESILGLGGLLAETETLRSELILLPVAVTLLSPLVAALTSPLTSRLPRRGGAGEFFDSERAAAVAMAVGLLAVVLLAGLAWSVSGALLIGLGARQLVLCSDERALRARRAGRVVRRAPSAGSALVAAVALAAGAQLAGGYGLALVALGMTATFASASACALARELFELRARRYPYPHRLPCESAEAAETTGSLAATMSLLVASGPVLVAESVQRGMVVDLVVAASPALLLASVVAAAAAGHWSLRLAELSDEHAGLRGAVQAVAATVALPALAAAVFGAGAAFGVALGWAAWAATAPALPPEGVGRPAGACGMAWARTMAMAALVCAPLGSG